jgi:membrane-associated phospholipid phosphatase
VRRPSLLALAAVALGAAGPAATAAGAQHADSARAAPEPLFVRRDAIVAGSFALATVALFPLDERIARDLQQPHAQANRLLHHTATDVELITSPGAMIIGGTLYVVGRLARLERVTDLGLHGTEAVVLGSATTGVLKGIAGRARPSTTGDSNPTDFGFLRGLGKRKGYTSFPSGHATAAFAAASAVTAETSRWWPRSTWIVGPAMYGGATLVALSRMYHNRHWASDVVLGAAVGTFSGLKVVRYNHTHPTNRLNRWLGAPSVAIAPDGGAAVAFSLRPP